VTTNEALATVNMLLSAATAVLLLAGRAAIRRHRAITRHRNLMIGAFACSAAFMVLFVTRFVVYGFRPYSGQGAARVAHYVMLFAHEPIAVISVPLAIVTLVLGLARSKLHSELSRPTLVIWLISSLTGVLLYVQLYALPS
jgi:putative membrane protein